MTPSATRATPALIKGLLFAAGVAFALPVAMVAWAIWGGN